MREIPLWVLGPEVLEHIIVSVVLVLSLWTDNFFFFNSPPFFFFDGTGRPVGS